MVGGNRSLKIFFIISYRDFISRYFNRVINIGKVTNDKSWDY